MTDPVISDLYRHMERLSANDIAANRAYEMSMSKFDHEDVYDAITEASEEEIKAVVAAFVNGETGKLGSAIEKIFDRFVENVMIDRHIDDAYEAINRENEYRE